jgi:hypothetical protein
MIKNILKVVGLTLLVILILGIVNMVFSKDTDNINSTHKEKIINTSGGQNE